MTFVGFIDKICKYVTLFGLARGSNCPENCNPLLEEDEVSQNYNRAEVFSNEIGLAWNFLTKNKFETLATMLDTAS